jgi:hypothetical protein
MTKEETGDTLNHIINRSFLLKIITQQEWEDLTISIQTIFWNKNNSNTVKMSTICK